VKRPDPGGGSRLKEKRGERTSLIQVGTPWRRFEHRPPLEASNDNPEREPKKKTNKVGGEVTTVRKRTPKKKRFINPLMGGGLAAK